MPPPQVQPRFNILPDPQRIGKTFDAIYAQSVCSGKLKMSDA